MAARHVGRFNGTWPEERAREEYPWLARGWLRQWAEGAYWGGGFREVIGDEETWRHPLMRAAYPAGVAQRLLRLHDERAALVDSLDTLPHVLCHLDAFRRNLASRRRDGAEETVAFDWPTIGIAAVGEEAGKMAATTVLFLEVEAAEAQALWEECISGYLAGLRDVGFGQNEVGATLEENVRFAAAVSGSLHWASTAAAFPFTAVGHEGRWMQRTFGVTTEVLLERWAPIALWLLEMGEEAMRRLGR